MKLLFAGGGTLGPVTPLLAVMQELKRQMPAADCVFVGTSRGPEKPLVEASGFRFVAFDSPKLRRYASLRTLWLPFEFCGALIRAAALLRKEQPDMLVGAGGYTSVPLGIAARLMSKKLLIHQQDVLPSLSNRILAPFANAITVTFEKSLADFPKGKTTLSGNPVRPAIEEASREKGLKLLGFSGERPIVLAVGGGTGSLFMNELIVLASPLWTGFADLVHLTGKEKSAVRHPNLTHPDRYRRFDFVGPEIAEYFAAADVVISRAGLGTLTELASLTKPTILIPIADSHQEANAAYIVENGGARMFRELDLTPEQLVTFTRDLLKKPEDGERLGKGLNALFRPGARQAVVEKIIELLKP
jgi:UDP-N-acetylglucosamine--N-acetylmuramyl-(pentapeptide) pyrophosphoryl-undecaprenol N-acetylglucosamine transferase